MPAPRSRPELSSSILPSSRRADDERLSSTKISANSPPVRKAVELRRDPGTTTVGMRVQLDHLAPTAVGHKVRAEATLREVEGRRLVFAVSVRDERGLVAAGKVTRVVVDIDRFMDKAR